jgi:hypothetical protein
MPWSERCCSAEVDLVVESLDWLWLMGPRLGILVQSTQLNLQNFGLMASMPVSSLVILSVRSTT